MIKRIAMTICSFLLAACAGERPRDLGLRDGLFKSCPDSPNCISSQAADQRHRIAPLIFNYEAGEAFRRLKILLAARGDATVAESTADYIRVEFRTRMGFVDDGEFLLDRKRSRIELRSASRVGYSDLGKNRSRMEEIRKQFQEGDNEQAGNR